MNPTNIILSERSQRQSNIYCMIKEENLKDVRSKGSCSDGFKNMSTNTLIFLFLRGGV